MLVIGTRPDAIKLSPVIRAVAAHPKLEPIVVSTGQHREMLNQVLALFGVAPDIDLRLMRRQQSLSRLTQRMLESVSDTLARVQPDVVVVQGDTTTAMASALAAFYAAVPVVHVEAGLRSGRIDEPFPEEANRRIAGVVAALHLAPTASARENLLREGIESNRIVVTGNTVIDALLWVTSLPKLVSDPALAVLENDDRKVILVTAHRRESWGTPLQRVGRALAEVAADASDALIVVPAHRNPIVRESLLTPLEGLSNVVITEPLDYANFCHLLRRAHVVVTDSGGLQEEAPSLGKPVLVLRDVTERPEGIVAGTAKLVGTRCDKVRDSILELLHDDGAYERVAHAINPYGDGLASDRTASAIAHVLGRGPRPDDFDTPQTIFETVPTLNESASS